MIAINEKYGVLVDPDNYTLVKRGVFKDGKRAGEEFLSAIGYYSSLDNALYAALDKMERDELGASDMSIGDAVTIIRRLHKDMKDLFRKVTEQR